MPIMAKLNSTQLKESTHLVKAFLGKQLRTFKKINKDDPQLIYAAEAFENYVSKANLSTLVAGHTGDEGEE